VAKMLCCDYKEDKVTYVYFFFIVIIAKPPLKLDGRWTAVGTAVGRPLDDRWTATVDEFRKHLAKHTSNWV